MELPICMLLYAFFSIEIMTLRYRMKQTSSFLSLLFLLLLFFTLRVAAIMALSVPVFSFNTNFISGIHADDKARGIELLARTYSTRNDSSEVPSPKKYRKWRARAFWVNHRLEALTG